MNKKIIGILIVMLLIGTGFSSTAFGKIISINKNQDFYVDPNISISARMIPLLKIVISQIDDQVTCELLQKIIVSLKIKEKINSVEIKQIIKNDNLQIYGLYMGLYDGYGYSPIDDLCPIFIFPGFLWVASGLTYKFPIIFGAWNFKNGKYYDAHFQINTHNICYEEHLGFILCGFAQVSRHLPYQNSEDFEWHLKGFSPFIIVR
jgi:hypothetical protein